MSTLSFLEPVVVVNHFPSKTRARRDDSQASHFRLKNKGRGIYIGSSYLLLNSRPQELYPFQNTSSTVSCTINMTQGQSDDPSRANLDRIMGEIKKVWESLPQPVKNFPWPKALENFLELALGLVYAVAKYLSVPVLAITSLSEMSYCAHERKMGIIPIPLLVGIVMATILRETALELYPHIKEGEFPWHLVAIAAFFTLLKLPGPYYLYWGRIVIPHLANGGLLSSLLFAFLWYRRPMAAPETTLQQVNIE